MAFPSTPLDFKVELYIGGLWKDITGYVRARSGIQVTRGIRSEGAQADPSAMSLTLANDGRFSPRNPLGAYYRRIGRNTPIRLGIVGSTSRGLTSGAGSVFYAADSAGLSITGDLDVRVDIDTSSWGQQAGEGLLIKYDVAGQRSWYFTTNADTTLRLYWSVDGTALLTADSTEQLPQTYGRLTLRATLDVNNGAGGKTVTFYTGTSVDGPWTQLGDPVTTAGTTSIFDSTAAVTISPNYGAVYAAKVLQGIGGTERANPDFTAVTSGATSFTDAAGNTWLLAGAGTEITNRVYRFFGEVPSWPVQWDPSGRDVYVPIAAAGIFRRLGQGDPPLKSTLYQGIIRLRNLVAYWPMEDGSEATSFGSATGGPAMTWVGAPTLATSTDFAASSPLPTLNNAQLHGRVANHQGTNVVQLRFVIYIPAAGTTNGAIIHRLYTTGTSKWWDLVYGTGGTLRLLGYDSSGAVIFDSGVQAFGMDGKLARVSTELIQNGVNIDFRMVVFAVGESLGLIQTVPSIAATFVTVGRAAEVYFDYNGNMDNVTVGHVSIEKVQTLDVQYTQFQAYVGETASERIKRLCEGEDLAIRIVGTPSTAEPMGPQRPLTFLELLRECEATDGGLLFEPKDQLGLAYRQRDAMYNRAVSVTLDYAAQDLAALEPVDDDQLVRNDVTVARVASSSARAVLESGALSVEAPPDGVGRYDTAITINPQTDTVLTEHAFWRLALGTVDEPRYPTIGVRLHSRVFTAVDRRALMDLDPGDRLVVTNPPTWLSPDDIDQGAIGFREDIGTFEHSLTVACVPASPYDVLVWDESGRWSPAIPSVLGLPATSTATSLTVATDAGPVWTTDSADLPLDVFIGGERMTVTAITGASSPQTFTVVRSVNGIVKAHSPNAEVSLVDPIRYAL